MAAESRNSTGLAHNGKFDFGSKRWTFLRRDTLATVFPAVMVHRTAARAHIGTATNTSHDDASGKSPA
eukprot:3612459-Alexandrium_andersonii.AAC.1